MPQVEEKVEQPKRRNLFTVVVEALNEIWDHFAHTRKIVRATCTVVGMEDEDCLLETLKELLQKQTITDLKEKNEKLKEEVKRLKDKLEDEKKANAVAATKLNESLELIRKVEGVVQQSTEVLNKARLFDEGLARNPVIVAKVVPVRVDFNQKMVDILLDLWRLFEGLQVEGLVPLDQIFNISINSEELLTL